ncbi:hypothetical protein EV656_11147 [Rhodovulum adriaticum]|uniref:Uncharacterized protein n=1 Tax=Rhodovulum adriaticum TaxID=35804 RepID=A0A4V2SKZ6_RHOAD|nr:hypothetical protein EV656_11147 [Rhodovulum adriaticum]
MMRSLALALLLAWPGIAPAQMFTDPVQVARSWT